MMRGCRRPAVPDELTAARNFTKRMRRNGFQISRGACAPGQPLVRRVMCRVDLGSPREPCPLSDAGAPMRFPTPRTLAVPLVAALVLGACGDSTAPTPRLRAPSAPTALLNDGSKAGGNPNFFFLPPVVPSPAGDPDFSAGQFAGGWKPVVDVCEVNAANLTGGCISGTVRSYSGAAVAVSLTDEQYQVQVDTKESWAVAGHTYRFTVTLLSNQPVTLGFVDIALLSGSAKNAGTGDLVSLQDGRTIPLKFRIEKGATVGTGVEVYSETVVTDAAGATILTGGTGAPGTFALQLPADFLPPELSQVVITVEKVSIADGNPCTLNVPNLLQTSDCWRITSFPEIPRVTQDLTVAFCPVILSGPLYEAQAMYKFDAPETLQELEDVATTLVNCAPAQIGAAPRKPGMMGAIQYGLASLGRGLSKAFGPNTAYAIDAGVGGRIPASDISSDEGVFSDFFFAIPLDVNIVSGNGQSGFTGFPLTSEVRVRVTSAHDHDNPDDQPIPIPNVQVNFAPGAGSVQLSTDSTDANGEIAATWTLGSAAGPQSLTASVNSIGDHTSVLFNATATATITSGIAASCGGTLYFDGQGQPGGDLLSRGFHIPSYTAASLGGVQLRLVGTPATVGTVTLTAYDGGYGGPVLGTTSASFTIPTSGNTLVLFAWAQPVPTTPGRTIAFAMSPSPAGLFYNVANTFDPGDPSCAIIETEDTNAPLSTFRRRGVEAILYATLPVIQ